MDKNFSIPYTPGEYHTPYEYQSPINVLMTQMQTQIEGDTYKAVLQYFPTVDKDELARALAYDRGQYNAGYQAGYNKALQDMQDWDRDYGGNYR